MTIHHSPSGHETLLRPATLDLGLHVGRSLADPTISSERRAALTRIYFNLNAAARQRANDALAANTPSAFGPACRLVVDNTVTE